MIPMAVSIIRDASLVTAPWLQPRKNIHLDAFRPQQGHPGACLISAGIPRAAKGFPLFARFTRRSHWRGSGLIGRTRQEATPANRYQAMIFRRSDKTLAFGYRYGIEIVSKCWMPLDERFEAA